LPDVFRKTTFYQKALEESRAGSSSHFSFIFSLVDLVQVVEQKSVPLLEHCMGLTFFHDQPEEVPSPKTVIFSLHVQTLLMPNNTNVWRTTMRFYEELNLPHVTVDDCRRVIKRLTKRQHVAFFEALFSCNDTGDDVSTLFVYLKQRGIKNMKIEDALGRYVRICLACNRRGLCLPRCSTCDAKGQKVYYCDARCQNSDWKRHKAECCR
jgi:hypothetical protein